MDSSDFSEPIALIPAAGFGIRAAPLACSKEIYPIGSRVACEYLISGLRVAGVKKAYIILRDGKWDIPEHLGYGGQLGLRLAYLVLPESKSVPFTLDQAWRFSSGSLVLLGFPDIIFEPPDAFCSLLKRLGETDAEVVLGLFPFDRPSTADMVSVSARGRVTGIEVKPAETVLSNAWAIAAWTPAFTDFLHGFMETGSPDLLEPVSRESELYLGHVLQAALEGGMAVEAVEFPAGSFIDIGDPEGLARAVDRYSSTDAAAEDGVERPS